MSATNVSRVQQIAASAVIDACWAQWTTLTTLATPARNRRVWTIVDPETLLLASLALGRRELRLEDMVAGWARTGSFLVSKPRLKRLASLFPPQAGGRIGDFARYAADAGDASWNRLASAPKGDDTVAREKAFGPLKLTEGPTLLLRLRAGFGVNAKADVMALLLGLQGGAANLKVITAALRYTERSVRTATGEMVLAGFVREIRGRPSSFYVEPQHWAAALQSYRADSSENSLPPWHYWAAVLSFLTAVDHWGGEATEHGWSKYVASSRARDLYERHEGELVRAGIALPPAESATGEAFLEVFSMAVARVDDWTREHLYG
jgi:hypothetical protein